MPPVSAARVPLPSRYRLVRHIAHGGMAGVWEAYDELLARPVAVKVLATHPGEDERARLRFQREARAAAGLSSHPNVVTIYDVGEHEGRSFMVMELMRGGAVADRLRRGERVGDQLALRWLGEAAAALDAAHEMGIVHRDVKPANMLLDERDRLALADFGIARVAWEDKVTQTGQVLGTAAYVSPEQAVGEPATAASDRYSLAVVAFELLTGDRPFLQEHFAAQARAHVEDDPPWASEREPGLSAEVDEVLDRGLAKEPEDRYESASAFVSALRGAIGTGSRPLERVTPRAPVAAAAPAAGRTAERTPAPPPPRTATPPPRTPDREWPPYEPEPRRRRPWWLAALAALVLAGGVAAAAVLTGGDEGGRAEGGAAEERATPTATPTPTPDETATPEATAAPEPTATPTPTPEATPTPAPDSEPTSSDPSELNAEGFSRFQQGDYAAAVPFFQRAVEECGDSDALDPCGFALYNLGASLRRSGNPDEAVPILEDRLDRFGDNEQGDVRRELRAARRASGGS